MADYYRDDFSASSLSSSWTISGSWALSSGALYLSETGTTESIADYGSNVGKGAAEIAASVNLNSNAIVGLQLLTAAGTGPGYEFAIDRDGSTITARIYRLSATKVRTEVASGAVTPTFADNRAYRLKGRIAEGGYQRADKPISLSLFFDDEDTAVLTYTDRDITAGLMPNYFSITGRKSDTGGGDCVIYVDSVIARRLMDIELPQRWSADVWTWDRLADDALVRLERGGNPQFSKTQMLTFLAFAEAEIVEKTGQPYWLDRTYDLSTSTMINTLPTWIDRVQDAILEENSGHLALLTRAEFNLKEPGRTGTGTPRILVFLGLDDAGACRYYVYPAPTASVTIELFVKGRPGYIHDSQMIPLVPPKHVEILIFGALRRAFQYDDNELAWRQNEKMWNEGVREIRRDNSRMVGRNARLIPEREAGRLHGWRSGTLSNENRGNRSWV